MPGIRVPGAILDEMERADRRRSRRAGVRLPPALSASCATSAMERTMAIGGRTACPKFYGLPESPPADYSGFTL